MNGVSVREPPYGINVFYEDGNDKSWAKVSIVGERKYIRNRGQYSHVMITAGYNAVNSVTFESKDDLHKNLEEVRDRNKLAAQKAGELFLEIFGTFRLADFAKIK